MPTDLTITVTLKDDPEENYYKLIKAIDPFIESINHESTEESD